VTEKQKSPGEQIPFKQSTDGNGPSLEKIERSLSSYVDPNGFVFYHNGNIYRAIYTGSEGLYRKLFESGTIQELITRHHLVETRISDITFPEAGIGMVLQHESVGPITYCVEWCPSMLRDAGCVLLDLALAVLKNDCILQDCYPWNVLFRGIEPVIIDFTSIIRIQTGWLWPAYEQFQSFFLRPLILSSQGKGKLARALLHNNITGIPVRDLSENVNPLYKVRHPTLLMQTGLNSYLGKNPSINFWLRKSIAGGQKHINRDVRYRFLNGLLHKLKRIRFDKNSDHWTRYYIQFAQSRIENAKAAKISEILHRIRPDSVLDIGCNIGDFSLIAAKSGARVISIDSSEACVERLYHLACQEKLRITPLVADLLCPTPAFGFLSKQYPALVDRVKSNLVMCLGLMHHLHIAGRQSIARIAEMMNTLSAQYLIFEFVDRNDDNNLLLGAGRSISYELQDVLDSLAKFFHKIDVLESDRPTRKLLLCAKQELQLAPPRPSDT